MLGVADHSSIFEIIETLFSGDIATTLEILRRLYQAGTDPVNIIEDILHNIHWLTKVHVTPSILDGRNVLEAERAFGLKMKKSLYLNYR